MGAYTDAGSSGKCAIGGGKYDRHLDVKNPDWEVEVVGPKLRHATSIIMRGIGHYSTGLKINSRRAADGGMRIYDREWE